ncbi:hypothetical protein AB0I81_34910 [Nonomuraea sp. NPDC050404]|uniref:hypothetical protein n=1 Tax=Nonomuraea sp. NPDC050404 TaxID=3155783 RepID=UPI0033CE63BA
MTSNPLDGLLDAPEFCPICDEVVPTYCQCGPATQSMVDVAPTDSADDNARGRASSVPLVDEGEARDGRARVPVGNKERASRWLRDEIGRDGLAGLFHRDGELVFTPRVGEDGYIPRQDEREDDGPAQVRLMSETELKTLVEIRYAPGIGRQRQEPATDPATGEQSTRTVPDWEPRLFPRECATNAHTAARMQEGTPHLRTLRGVTHTPTMRPDGSVIDQPGYDLDTGVLYLPGPGLDVLPVPSAPTPAETKMAVELIVSIVAEFPFVEEHHRANWYGALFTPILRAIYPSPYPVFVIDAPAPGSGKSYLANILRTVHGGILRAGWPQDDAELTKGILGILMHTTAPVVTFDNVRGRVRSAKFEALLTSAKFSERILGANRDGAAPNDRLWTITANNAEIDGDLARRVYWITIDPRVPRPQDRTRFSLDLKTWVPANRGRIIQALLIIVRAWVLAGSPKGPPKRGDDYARWDAAVEGLLSWAGFSGQFGKPDNKHLDSTEDQEWAAFLAAAYEVMGETSFKMADLVGKIASEDPYGPYAQTGRIAPSTLPGDLAEKWSRGNSRAGFTKSLGKWFTYRAGRYVGDLTVKVWQDRKNGNTFRIERWDAEQEGV